jgi:glycosyltransferase involved in cell wall biosynthesis
MTSPKLSIVIPVFNERPTILTVIESVQASLQRQGLSNHEIIAVNDGSTDGTAEVLETVPGIRFIDLMRNCGKGGAVKAGFEAATGDIFLIQDADLEYNPDDYSAVIAPIAAGRADVVMGSRFLKERPRFFIGKKKSPYFAHYVGNNLIVILTNVLYRYRATDYEGCYKAFRREVIRAIPIRSNGFEYDNELICKVLKRKLRVVEVPIHYKPRTYGQGKKINWRHGMRMLWTIVKYRFVN